MQKLSEDKVRPTCCGKVFEAKTSQHFFHNDLKKMLTLRRLFI